MKKAPLYSKVQTTLLHRIEKGIYPAGSTLPPEPELCNEFNASRTTIRKAVGLLSDEGYVNIQQGRGTTVLDRSKISQELNSVTSLLETFREQGCSIKTKETDLSIVKAEDYVADALELNQHEDVYRLHRIIEADGKVVAVINNFLLPSFIPNFELHLSKMDSLYLFLEQFYDLSMESAVDCINARMTTDIEMEQFECNEHSPVIVIKRTGMARERIFYYSETVVNSPDYQLKVFLKGRKR